MNPLKIILPIIVLVGSGIAVYLILVTKPEPDTKAPEPVIPSVEVVEVDASTIPLTIRSQGSVQARTETTLNAEVAGRVLTLSPNFRPGGFVSEGEVLVTIDPSDYEANLAGAQANLSEAMLDLAQQEALAEQAKVDWQELGRGEPTELALNLPQVERAKAEILSAQAAMERAERDLERTEIKAPYDGRVLEQQVDIGGYVTGGPTSPVGRIYSTETAEVRLPVTDDEIAYLGLPFSFRDEREVLGPKVVLSADFGGETHRWEGHIIRSEAAVDARSRLYFVVASVEDPYKRDPDVPNRPPLKVGMFVQAEIEGISLGGAITLPRTALVGNETVLIATPEDRLQRRTVQVAHSDTQSAIVTQGLEPGERVILTPLQYVVNDMPLKVVPSGEPTTADVKLAKKSEEEQE
ncbi:MAG: efflux RND transporter periplasmic adaptor subunit [Verrucomicrobiota bacterium]